MEDLTGGKTSVLKRYCGAFVAAMVWRLSRRPKLVLVCAEGPPTTLCMASSSLLRARKERIRNIHSIRHWQRSLNSVCPDTASDGCNGFWLHTQEYSAVLEPLKESVK